MPDERRVKSVEQLIRDEIERLDGAKYGYPGARRIALKWVLYLIAKAREREERQRPRPS